MVCQSVRDIFNRSAVLVELDPMDGPHQASSLQSMRVAFSDHSTNPVCGFRRARPVLHGTNSTESNLIHHGETTYRVGRMIWLCYSHALERRCLIPSECGAEGAAHTCTFGNYGLATTPMCGKWRQQKQPLISPSQQQKKSGTFHVFRGLNFRRKCTATISYIYIPYGHCHLFVTGKLTTFSPN